MNPLALLCNLHADGPLTLQRLRRAGCETLSALADLDFQVLCTELGGDEARAERFLREAELLHERIEGDPAWRSVQADEVEEDEDEDWDDEEPDVEEHVVRPVGPAAAIRAFERPPEGPAPAQGEDPGRPARRQPSGATSADHHRVAATPGLDSQSIHHAAAPERKDEPAEEAELAASRRRGIEPILETWRSLDLAVPPADLEPSEGPEPAADLAPGSSAAGGPEDAEPRLGAVSVDGLTPELVARLAEVGIGSVPALLEADPLTLSRSLALPYTRVTRLQFLARRAAPPATSGPASPGASASGRSHDEGPPRGQGSSEGWLESAGPFA